MEVDYNAFFRLPHTKAEGDWLEERFRTMSAKESFVLAAALQRSPPESIVDGINLLTTLQNYLVCSPAQDYEALGLFSLKNRNISLPEDILTHVDLTALGEQFADKYPGLFIVDSYVMYPTAPEQKPYDGTNLAAIRDSWAVKVKLGSTFFPEGVWLRLPDYSDVSDTEQDETVIALKELHAEKLEDCTILDAVCVLPEAGNLMEQYSNPLRLISDGNSLGYLLDGCGDSTELFEEKLAEAFGNTKCRTLEEVLTVGQALCENPYALPRKSVSQTEQRGMTMMQQTI